MKAFEEWYAEEIKDKGKDYWLPWPSAAKMGWKAALEWILKQPEVQDFHHILEFIDDELEELQ